MKIIDNKKDFYDYLMGVYGIDNKVVYDRRNSFLFEDRYYNNYFKPSTSDYTWAWRVYVKLGDWIYTFERKNKTDEWGMPEKVTFGHLINVRIYSNPCSVENFELKIDNSVPVSIVLSFTDRADNLGIQYGKRYEYTLLNPILSKFPFIKKYIGPEIVWQRVYDYISKRNEPEVMDNRTDVQHLESAGFDKKTSFRNIK